MLLSVSKTWIGLCVLFGSLYHTSAIFEEQLGEFDWKRENIGLVDASFVIRDELIVSTADGVLACLDSDSGSTKWRVVLPHLAKIVKFVEVEGQLVTLVTSTVTASLNENVVSMTVRSWSVSDGSLLWDTFLGNSAVDKDAGGVVDVMYDSASKQITVLFDNALHFVTAPASQAATPAYWSWSASTDVASTPAAFSSTSDAFSGSQRELTLTLSSLIAPTSSPELSQSSRSDNSVMRRAVGCYVRAAVGACDGDVVVVKVSQGSVALDVFSAFPEDVRVLVADLTAAVSSDAALSYQANDVVFASSGAGKSLAVLGLGANQLVADFPLQGGAQDVVKTFVYVGADGELRPAASVCTRSACQSIVAMAPSSTSSASASWAARRLEDGKADCEGGDVRLQFVSYRFFDRVVHAVSCLAVSAPNARLASVSLKAGGSVAAKSTFDLTPFDVTVPPFHHPASDAHAQHFLYQNDQSAVHHLALLPVKAKKGSAGEEQCAGHKLLTVLHSGHTIMLSLACNPASPPSCALGGLLQWSRLEGLARAQQAVVLDRVDTGSAAQDSSDSMMPSFTERLVLQRAKVLNYVASGSDTIAAMMDAAKDAVHGLSARISGKSAAALGGRKPLRRRDVDKLKTFGFDKVAAVLCYSAQLASRIEMSSGKGVPFAQAGLQLMFVDLLRTPAQGSPAQDEEIRSVRYLSLGDDSVAGEEEVVFVKLLPNSAPTRRLSSAAEGASSPTQTTADPVGKFVTLIVGTASGRTYFWDVDPAGATLTATKVCAAADSCSLSQSTPAAQKVFLERYAVRAGGSERAGAPAAIAATAAFSGPAYTVLHSSPSDDTDLALVTVLHDQHMTVASAGQPVYVHAVDKISGRITVYKTSTNVADVAACTSLHYSAAAGPSSGVSHRLRLSCVPVRASASARFDPRDEKIVAVTYPSAQDAVHVPYSILGDDSVLLKYLNPHVALVTTIATAASASSPIDPEASTAESAAVASDDGPIVAGEVASERGSVLFWTLVDTVTGKVILRLHQESAALPVHAILMENHIVATYWNTKAKRTELSSTALYEGVIDNVELTPFASSRARSNSAYLAAAAASASSKVRSAYSSIPPIAMQKTYTLPRAVSALHHTVTAHGLSNKNLLLGLRNGQVYSVDLKQVHPRRPFSDPSTAEKTEGLVRYSPFVTLMPLSALTHNYSMPRGVSRIVSSASNLESSSLVLSFGGAAVDMHLNRVMPSQDFDLLSSDFNYSLLVAILLALATAVLFLRNLQQRKHLGTIWA